jgi:glycosyltransferase involved in cell wall biosynthesis
VPLHDIGVEFDAGLRVVQLVTTIQLGGAERVALDLAHEANRNGVQTTVAALAQPTRRSFPKPKYFADLSDVENDPDLRADAVQRLCLEWGADVVHAHLIRADEAEAIRARGLPLVITAHNKATSWPADYLAAQNPFADLFIGCAHSVTRDIAAHIPHARVRTVWNGIDARRALPQDSKAGAELRASLGWDATDFVLLAIANPRSQKRLERLPEIVVRTEERLGTRRVRLLIAGEPSIASEDARKAVAKLEREIETWHVQKALHWAGAIDDVSPYLAASDVFVSTSGVEGFSLAQLEALAAGLPLVVTAVGGATELSERSDRVCLVPPDADAEQFASALAQLASAGPARKPALPAAFTRDRMQTRTQLLYRGVLASVRTARKPRRTVWLLTNNFSIGGAQTSARRLLMGLAERGHPVRAATIEEAPERLSPGRRLLESSGVAVLAIRPNSNPEVLAAKLLDALTAAPPHAVLFWNLITSVKVLIADALTDIPVFDISPGEMYFDSLQKFFRSVLPGLPVLEERAYGARLAGIAVKYAAEAPRAAKTLGVCVHIIPNGVPLLPARKPLNSNRLIIGTAARISPDKRLDQLIDAIRIAHSDLPPYEIRIAGGSDGMRNAHLAELRRRARDLPIRWLGPVSDSAPFLQELDLFAMISEPAGCPNASLEAMAAGLPIVATDHGGVAEQVLDGINGRLVPRGDVRALAKALVSLGADRATRERFGSASRQRAASEFSMESMLDRYSDLLGL